MNEKEKYFNDLFYGSTKLNTKIKKEILYKALMMAYDYSLEIRERDSFTRKIVSKEISTIREFTNNNFSSNSLFVFIKRVNRNSDISFGEVGFTNVNSEGSDYYIFIYVSESFLNDMIEKYKLKLI